MRVGCQSDRTASPGSSTRIQAVRSLSSSPLGRIRRKGDDPPLGCIRPPQQPLDERLVANLALARPDHVALIEDDQSDVIDQRRVAPEGEVELFWRRDHNLARTKRILVAG